MTRRGEDMKRTLINASGYTAALVVTPLVTCLENNGFGPRSLRRWGSARTGTPRRRAAAVPQGKLHPNARPIFHHPIPAQKKPHPGTGRGEFVYHRRPAVIDRATNSTSTAGRSATRQKAPGSVSSRGISFHLNHCPECSAGPRILTPAKEQRQCKPKPRP